MNSEESSPKKSFDENSPLKELATEADAALKLCWERLEARTVDAAGITEMVRAWRMKRFVHTQKEQVKEETK